MLNTTDDAVRDEIVTVTLNTPPTLDRIRKQTALLSAGEQTIGLTGITSGDSGNANALKVFLSGLYFIKIFSGPKQLIQIIPFLSSAKPVIALAGKVNLLS